MKVFLRDIPDQEEGLTVQSTMTAGELDLPADGFQILSPLSIQAHLTKTALAVTARVEAKGQYAFICARCVAEIEQDRVEKFDFIMEITPDTEFVDLNSDIREELIIAISPIMVCRPDCKGLCARCGRNLNVETCSCTTSE